MERKQESRSSASESASLAEDELLFWVERENQESEKREKWEDTKEMKGEDEENDDKEERVEYDLSVTQTMGSRITMEKFTDLQKFVESQKSSVSDKSNSSDSLTVNTSRSSWNEAYLTDHSSSCLVEMSSTDDSLGNYEAHMSTDSVEEYQDMVRTLQHYRPRISRRRRRRRRRQRLTLPSRGSSSPSSTSSPSTSSSSSRSTVSTDSDCSCASCSSSMAGVTKKYFGAEVGPPGGEGTRQRRAAIWLESIKYLWGILFYGLLVLSILFLATAIWMTQRVKEKEFGYKMLYWSIPFVVVMTLLVLAWQGTWHILLRLGYGDGYHIQDRRNFIEFAQKRELVYTIRGAIYAPTNPDPTANASKACSSSTQKPPSYSVVAYESEYDSDLYFDSDLDSDGQYRRSITPLQGIEDPGKRERRNIYTRRAWRRDVPVIWWEVWNQPPRDF
ncbi:uncharacterized protein LOC125032494 [Penaeus chinensis]|uniref:uncharacterized protein LOC125032494 n=1 Tax=Penaeus chinensis TaxID=139456 RepID=UPI001FB5AB52|nr:uncharacterized protein LOC125032494 [Penaeus chinensis]XP_047479611.1 uncharacterized protein LOC125032494 [Penaeus chinensis]XP_047479612.1 uncharacterized protein LOC125032494 [Penaeus chinensis]